MSTFWLPHFGHGMPGLSLTEGPGSFLRSPDSLWS